MTQTKVRAGASWRKTATEGVELQLLSGEWVRIRSVPIDQLIATGELPDILTPLAAKVLWDSTEAQKLGQDVELAKQYVELCNKVVTLALVEPKVVDNPQKDGEVGIWQIPLAERSELLTYAMQPAQVLANFRTEQARVLATLSNGQDNQ